MCRPIQERRCQEVDYGDWRGWNRWGETDRVRRAQGAIHCDFPLEEIGFVHESDGDAGWGVSGEIT